MGVDGQEQGNLEVGDMGDGGVGISKYVGVLIEMVANPNEESTKQKLFELAKREDVLESIKGGLSAIQQVEFGAKLAGPMYSLIGIEDEDCGGILSKLSYDLMSNGLSELGGESGDDQISEENVEIMREWLSKLGNMVGGSEALISKDQYDSLMKESGLDINPQKGREAQEAVGVIRENS